MSEKKNKNENENIINDVRCTDESCDGIIDEGITVVCGDEESGEAARERKRADDMFDRLLRLQAEFDNYRKRTLETNKTVREDGRREVIEKLLPVLDATEQAHNIIKDQSILKGLSLITIQLSDALTAFGVKKIEAIGQDLDPDIHEVIGMRADGNNSGKVIEVFRSGYIMNGRIIRPAAVIIGE